MSAYLVVDPQGNPSSYTTVAPADPKPGYTVVTLTDANYLLLTSGAKLWQAGQIVDNPTYTAAQLTNTTAADLLAKARTALTNNATFVATVPTRRSAIAADKATATAGQSATVGNVAQAQTQIRSSWTVVTHAATALDDLNNQIEALTKQNTTLIKLLAGLVMGATDLLQDETGT